MIRKCAMCKKEVDDKKEKTYTFAIGEIYNRDNSLKRNRIHYGRLCASCFSKLSLEEMDK
jgi:hypothetical protein